MAEENWKMLAPLLPTGWQQMAWQSGAIKRLRGFASTAVLLRMLLLHVAKGYSLRETVARAKLANWTGMSDVALLKRLRASETWLHGLCIELKELAVGESGLWMVRSSKSQVGHDVNGGFYTASNCQV